MKTIIGIVLAVALAGCSALSNVAPLVSQQHPGLAMNQGTCQLVGIVLAGLTGFAPAAAPAAVGLSSALAGAVMGNAACGMWNGVVDGQGAVTTTTTTTTQSQAKGG
ncbi:MAG: hypothetical protein KGI71_05535 [Patescibacteria group bacterium]|nr:hypothetical protein [Patescibacteria group bacterium]